MSADNVIFGVDFKRHIYNSADRNFWIGPDREAILKASAVETTFDFTALEALPCVEMPSDSPPYVAPEGDSA